MAREDDVELLSRHVLRHSAESGREGSPHFALARDLDPKAVRRGFEERLRRRLDEPAWGRAWVLRPGAPARGIEIVGHIELRGGRVPAELHRAVLGMGIQRAYTGRGLGRRLMIEAVSWAVTVAELDWLDLGVFAQNTPALKLYERAGFVVVGRTEDAFVLDSGLRVEDVRMALDLRGGKRWLDEWRRGVAPPP
jgi:RimJ/RimL family protein N-acetyltransferase